MAQYKRQHICQGLLSSSIALGSTPPMQWLLALGILCLTVLALKILLQGSKASPPLPPGPKPLPLLGNALDFPQSHYGPKLHALAKKYGQFSHIARSLCAPKGCTGDVVYLKLFGQPVLVLDSYAAANELLDKRSANYSDRPQSVMAHL